MVAGLIISIHEKYSITCFAKIFLEKCDRGAKEVYTKKKSMLKCIQIYTDIHFILSPSLRYVKLVWVKRRERRKSRKRARRES